MIGEKRKKTFDHLRLSTPVPISIEDKFALEPRACTTFVSSGKGGHFFFLGLFVFFIFSSQATDIVRNSRQYAMPIRAVLTEMC